jgi:subtilase family protein
MRVCAAVLGGVLLLSLAAAASARAPRPALDHSYKQVCKQAKPGFMHCNAEVAVRSHKAFAAASGFGYGPADLQKAYGMTSAAATRGGDQTIAIIDAYDAPRAEADLAVYRAKYGLPPCASANGCFRKVDQNGGASFPQTERSWAQEIALDLDMASAMCPHCKLLLVEASSASAASLATAANTAAALGATQISNSYGGPEFPSETYFEQYYNHKGVSVVASSGDSGFGVEYPAASAYVTAVGGTSLVRDSSPRGWSETAWAGAGSGCSAYILKPAWQTDTGCATRAVADVSAVADPGTGVAAFDSGSGGWGVYGGTSAAAPLVAGSYALMGNAAGADYGSYAYQNPGAFRDVVSGGNGPCSLIYLCTAGIGFDGPTGVGTPNGGDAVQAPSGNTAAKPALPSVKISRNSLRVTRSGTLRLRLSCPAGAACSGKLVLRTRAHGSRVTLSIGKRGFYVPAGKSRTVTVRLTKRVRAMLDRSRKLQVSAAAASLDTEHSAAAATFLLRAPKATRS